LRLARIQKDTHQFLQWQAKQFVNAYCQQTEQGWVIHLPRNGALHGRAERAEAPPISLLGKQRAEAGIFFPAELEIGRPVIQEAFVQMWGAAGWPRGMMGFREWSALLALVGGELRSVNLPGGLVANVAEDGSVVVKRGNGD